MVRLEMFWSKFEGCHHIFLISLSMSGIAQNDIHNLLYTSSRWNLDIIFNLIFSDVISYESFYIASLFKKIQFENVGL